MSKFARILSLLIVTVLFAGMLAACTQPTQPETPVKPDVTEPEKPVEPTEPPAEEEPVEEEPVEEEPVEEAPEPIVYEDEPYGEDLPTAPTIDKPFVVAYSDFSEKFSPFFSETAYDADVASMTQIGLMTTDRLGKIVENAIEGEVIPYNNVDYMYKGAANLDVDYDEATDTTTYKARLRVGMKFSDGEPVTADDVIFTYYTYLDPSYVGSTSLNSYPIVGLQEYLTQTPSAVLERYQQYAKDIFEAGRDHEHSDSDAWTKELQDAYWAEVDKFGIARTQEIVDYVAASYIDNYAEAIGKTPDEVRESDGLKVALGMALWGFGGLECKEEVAEGEDCPEEAGQVFKPANTDKSFDLETEFPTVEDYYADILAAYENDVVMAWDTEAAGDITDVKGVATTEFIKIWGPKDAETGGEGVPNIAGIKKIDDYNIEVVLNGFSAPAVYSVLGVSITPLHYYGDREKYDYENNKFGFDYGDLSKQQSLTAKPMGAGAYKFVEYDNRIVRFEANEYYYKGCPKIREIQFKETDANEVASALKTGDADAGELSGSRTRFEEVMGYNSNGELVGDVITLSKVDNLGYGYIGINADTVNVGGEPGSDASKALRKAIATIYAVHRDVAVNTYYGEAASVINYPISNTSWAAPQPTDDDYQIAFSVDVDGNPIYTAEMTLEEKVEAAKAAALGFFEKAGYTIENGKITGVPEGAKDTYEVIVPGQGKGEHPAFAVLTDAEKDLAELGFTLVINDPSNANVLWSALDAGSQEMWTAAWGSTIDPDMYQVYHSANVVGEGGTDSNHYHIRDAQLDQYILDARKSEDQNYRKAIYKQALDTVVDWAVEIPTYQRQNCIVFSTERINLETITPDITTFWGWMNDIQLIEMMP